MCWEKKSIIFFFTDWGFDWSFKVMKYKMKYNKEMHQSCERDKIVKNPWIAIKYRSSIKGQWRRKKGRNIFYFTGGSCDHVAMLSWRMWMWRQDNKTRGEKMRMCPHWQINLHQQATSGRKMETPRHNFTIHYFIQLWRKKKCKTNLCSLCIQYSGTNLFSLSNSKYDILNFYLGEEALIVILVLFVKCKIIYFFSKHKWRIATQIFANFTNCIFPNYTTSALTGTELN